MKAFVVTCQNIVAGKKYSIINILGLALGTTSFFLLAAYIIHESSYEKFYPNVDRIAFVTTEYKYPEDKELNETSATATIVGSAFKDNFSEVEDYTRIINYPYGGIIQKENDLVKENDMLFVDSTFFNVLSYSFTEGNRKTALNNPSSIVLTESMSEKYFPNQSALGKTISIDNNLWMVTGIVPDPPSYTQFDFDAVLSVAGIPRYQEKEWGPTNDLTLLLLKNESNFSSIEKKMQDYLHSIREDFYSSGADYALRLVPLASTHLESKVAGNGNKLYVYIFGIIAVSILLISCINFTNLTLSRSIERTKEIGIKKVLGASKKTIFSQFLAESAIMVFVAMAVGFAFAYFLIPVFGNYLNISFEYKPWNNADFYIGITLFFVLVTILAGGWPSIAIASFKPMNTLKGKISGGKKGFAVQKSLLFIQFCVSILFIICTLIANQQLKFIQYKSTGLNRSQIVVLPGNSLKNDELTVLKNKIQQAPSISGVSASYDSPVNIQGGYTINKAEGKSVDFNRTVTAIPVEKDFVSVFEIPIIAGENFSEADVKQVTIEDENLRKHAFIINELTAQDLGWKPEEAIGKSISLNGRKGNIKAVVKNFNFASFHSKIKPLVIFPEYDYFGNIFIKLAVNADVEKALATIKSEWSQLKPTVPFEYHFLDEDYAKLYTHEYQTRKVLLLFSVITISIACLGLFAISSFAIQKRVKEIGIRKVIGASVFKIVKLLSIDFLKLVGISFLVSIPLGWMIMNKWLDNFVYHIDISWTTFAIAGILGFLITILTVSSQAIKAGLANPVYSLRDE